MTPSHLRALDYTRNCIERTGISPTLSELASHVGCSTPNAKRIVDELDREGLIRRVPARRRGIYLADRPDLRAVSTDALRAELARRGSSFQALRDRPDNFRRGAVTCAADCCQVTVRVGHLFCRDHWFELPLELRQRILTAFGAKDADAYQEAVTEARDRIDGSFHQRREID